MCKRGFFGVCLCQFTKLIPDILFVCKTNNQKEIIFVKNKNTFIQN